MIKNTTRLYCLLLAMSALCLCTHPSTSIAPVSPRITIQPQSQAVTVGQNVAFSVTATGTVPLLYQWYKNGFAISGADSSRYSISDVQAADSGTYTVIVSNGTLPNATSNGALLTVEPLIVADIDGNVYQTVTIGTQVWMVENLKTTRYNDGTVIPLITDNDTWAALTTPGYCWYNNDSTAYKSTYGALYNWYTVNTGKLAPTGWHVPADSEWTVLTDYLGGWDAAGGPLKDTGTAHWVPPNIGATNETGFTALPGGMREDIFMNIGSYGFWWSSTTYDASSSWYRFAHYDNAFFRMDNNPATFGYSVRCVKD
jgi:uncharacterized protein (TIGR02145 family)